MTVSAADVTTYFETVAGCASVTGILLIPANILLIYALLRQKAYKPPSCWLFVNLALIDCVYLAVHIWWFWKQYCFYDSHQMRNDTELPNVNNDSLGMFIRITEKSCEEISSYTTAAIAILRALSVWKAVRKMSSSSIGPYGVAGVIAAVWLFGISGPTMWITVHNWGDGDNCKYGLIPMFGHAERYHSIVQVIAVNIMVIAAYSYICIVLYRHNVKVMRLGIVIVNRPHSRTINFLIAYTVLYNFLTLLVHASLIYEPGCLGPQTTESDIVYFKIMYPCFPIGACGFNPIFLYALSDHVRKSVRLISMQHGCFGGSSNTDDI